jgi:hypothetical protein
MQCYSEITLLDTVLAKSKIDSIDKSNLIQRLSMLISEDRARIQEYDLILEELENVIK